MKKKSPLPLLFKMGRREVRGNWSQFLSIISIGAIAVTLFVGLLANADSFENRMYKSYSDGNLADLYLVTSAHYGDDLLRVKETVGTNGEVEGRLYLSCDSGSHVYYVAVSPSLPKISTAYSVTDTSAEYSETNYFLLDKTLFSASATPDNPTLKVGDEMTLGYDFSSLGLSENSSFLDDRKYLLEGGKNIFKADRVEMVYPITGMMSSPENITKSAYNSSTILMSDSLFKASFEKLLSKNFTAEGKALIYSFMAEQMGFGDDNPLYNGALTRPNQYLVSVNNHDKSLAESLISPLRKSFSDYYGGSDNNILALLSKDDMPFAITLVSDVRQARQFTFLFPLVFFVVGVLVILTTTSELILKERTEIGTMKALGLSKFSIYNHYVTLTGSLVFIGTLIGEILGPIIIPLIMDQKYQIIYSLPALTYSFPLLYGILTAVGFLAVTALVTILICHHEVKLLPAESMRPEPPKMKAKERKAHAKKPSVRFLSFKMALRNIRLSPLKSLMVEVGVMGCTALLCCGYGIGDTVSYGIENDLRLVNSDISLTFSETKTQEEIDDSVIKEKEIAGAEGFTRGVSTITNGEKSRNSFSFLVSSLSNSHMDLSFPLDQVAISDSIAGDLSATLGDEITFTYGGSTYSAIVGLVYKAFSYNGVVAKATSPIFEGKSVFFSNAWVDVADNSSNDAAKAALMEKYASGVEGGFIAKAQTEKEWNDYISGVVGGVSTMTSAVKVFAILLALVVLYNLALLNFRERTRDIATLKVLGFSTGEIAASLLYESMSLTFFGVLFGLLLGYPFLLGVLGLNQVSLVAYLYMIYPLTYFYAFLLTFVVAFLVNFLFALKSKDVKMVESLKSVE